MPKIESKKRKSVMETIVLLVLAGIIALFVYRFSVNGGSAKAAVGWDCSVACAGKSIDGGQTIAYSDVVFFPETGTLTFQNRNAFDIVVHLLSGGETETFSAMIPAGGCCSFMRAEDRSYRVGVSADVEAGTRINVVVYDGTNTETYILNHFDTK